MVFIKNFNDQKMLLYNASTKALLFVRTQKIEYHLAPGFHIFVILFA